LEKASCNCSDGQHHFALNQLKIKTIMLALIGQSSILCYGLSATTACSTLPILPPPPLPNGLLLEVQKSSANGKTWLLRLQNLTVDGAEIAC